MYATPQRRGLHRKRLSALRLSSDSTVTTLPVYTSPPRHRLPDLPDIPSEQPPAYPDSANEADEDTDASDDDLFVPSLPPSLPVSPRLTGNPHRRPRLTRGHRRQQSLASASDPYLDSLLERSVHALEMSNALLQSSMSTQSSLSAVLADDPDVDRSIEQRTQALATRMQSNRNMHESWMDDLDQISRGVEGLVRGEEEDEEESNVDVGDALEVTRTRLQDPISQSLPTGGLEQRMQRRQGRRRASQDFRQDSASSSTSNLQLSTHDRSVFIAPAPRALTMYIDSSEAADAIALPSTLGVRPAARPQPTPLPSQTSFSSASSEAEPSASEEQPRRVVDMLASFVMPRSTSSVSSSPSSSSLLRRRDSSSSSGRTVKRSRASKSPPPSLQIDTPSASSRSLRSRSLTPTHGSPMLRQCRPLTPPIEELSTSSTSSDSTTLHVERTVDSLRQILERQRSAAGRASTSSAPPPLPRPSLLSPPTVAPISSTSTATAHVSRLFTKNRHTSSTRPPSPPKQSSMKGRSAPSTPITPLTPSLPTPSSSSSLLNVPDVFGSMLGVRPRSGTSSGASTPKRISFAEPPEPYSSSKPAGASAQFRASKGKAKERGRAKGKGKAREGSGSDAEKGSWWASWLLAGAGAGGNSASGVGRARSEERYGYPGVRGAGTGVSGTWAMRPGLEEWGA